MDLDTAFTEGENCNTSDDLYDELRIFYNISMIIINIRPHHTT